MRHRLCSSGFQCFRPTSVKNIFRKMSAPALGLVNVTMMGIRFIRGDLAPIISRLQFLEIAGLGLANDHELFRSVAKVKDIDDEVTEIYLVFLALGAVSHDTKKRLKGLVKAAISEALDVPCTPYFITTGIQPNDFTNSADYEPLNLPDAKVRYVLELISCSPDGLSLSCSM